MNCEASFKKKNDWPGPKDSTTILKNIIKIIFLKTSHRSIIFLEMYGGFSNVMVFIK